MGPPRGGKRSLPRQSEEETRARLSLRKDLSPRPSPARGSAGEVMSTGLPMETAEGGLAVPSAAGLRPHSLGPHGSSAKASV